MAMRASVAARWCSLCTVAALIVVVAFAAGGIPWWIVTLAALNASAGAYFWGRFGAEAACSEGGA